MRNFILILLLVLGLVPLTFSSCGKDEKDEGIVPAGQDVDDSAPTPSPSSSPSIVGTWKFVSLFYGGQWIDDDEPGDPFLLIFQNDGNGFYTGGKEGTFSYTYNDGFLITTYSDGEKGTQEVITLTETTLILHNTKDESKEKYIRQ